MVRRIVLVACAINALACSFNGPDDVTARGRLSPGQRAPIYVLLKFDGDGAFPSLTWQQNTAGLSNFTGTRFGLSAPERDSVVASIVAHLQTDYAEFTNVQFVTSLPSDARMHVTWGIDDRAFAFSNDGGGSTDPVAAPLNPFADCPEVFPHSCSRLFGKAGPTPDPNERDNFGSLIHHPTHARTFAGSFTIPSTGASPSMPALILGESDPTHLRDTFTPDLIAHALSNSAAHEIAHLFRVGHPDCRRDDGDSSNDDAAACQVSQSTTKNLMISGQEWSEAHFNNGFSALQLETLRKTLTRAATADAGEPGNDDELTPTVVGLGAFPRTLHDPLDQDYFTFTVPQGQPTVEIKVTHEFPANDMGLRQLVSVEIRQETCTSAGCAQFFHPIEATTTGYRIKTEDVAPGDRFFVKVYQSRPRLPVAYLLTVGLAPDRFDVDDADNGTPATAAIWSPTVCDYSGLTTHDGSDADFYSVSGVGASIEATLTYDPTFGNLSLTLDGQLSTEVISQGIIRSGRTLEQHASLLIYDRDRDLTWLRDTSSRGRMTFTEAQVFIAELNTGAFGGGRSWRLPDVDPLDAGCSGPAGDGFGCTGGELGHVFYDELSNIGALPPAGGLTNRGPFANLIAEPYWSGIEDGFGDIYVFNFFNGFQTTQPKLSEAYAWAVHEGDLAPGGAPLREVRIEGCGLPASIVGVAGAAAPYSLCIRRTALASGCPGFVDWTPFAATGSFDYVRTSPFVPGPPAAVHANIQPRVLGRILSQDAAAVHWQIAAFADYGQGVVQGVLASLDLPSAPTPVDFRAHVLDQSNLTEWFQVTGQCTAGRTDLVSCNADTQCDTTLGAGGGMCTLTQTGSGSFTGPADQITSFQGTSGVDAMYWNVFEPVDRGTLQMSAARDSDRDCIADDVEIMTGTDPMDDDTDGDGIPDGGEDLNCNGVVDFTDAGGGSAPELGGRRPAETDPRKVDSDGDGLSDGLERGLVRPGGVINAHPPGFVADSDPASTTDPTRADSDGDGLADGVEDANRNGRQDPGETSPLISECAAGPGATDSDGDGKLDACDSCPLDPNDDADADGFCADADNCPAAANSDQIDTDGDGVGNACDGDDDGDGIPDAQDNCPLEPNSRQRDYDRDSQGNRCDADDDGDGVNDGQDRCPRTAPGAPVSMLGCSIADLCPCGAHWRSHRHYVACVKNAAERLADAHIISEAQRRAVTSAARHSRCGRHRHSGHSGGNLTPGRGCRN